MGDRFDGQLCVICATNPSVGVGEHVWPRWFLDEFTGQGPFYTEKSGEPIVNRNGDVATHNALWGRARADVPALQRRYEHTPRGAGEASRAQGDAEVGRACVADARA